MKKITGLAITLVFLAGFFGLLNKTKVAEAQDSNPNLITNASLETGTTLPTNWQKGGWGTSTKTYTYPVAGQEGAKAAKVKITGYKNGDAKWYFDDVTVKPNTKYTFSEYYISTVATEIDIRYTLTTGAQKYVVLNKPAKASVWTKKEFTFTTPANAKSMTIFHILAKNGELTIDNFSLTETITGTPIPTATATATPVATSSSTPVVTATPVPTIVPTVVPTSTPIATVTPTATVSPTTVPTVAPTPTATTVPTTTPTPIGNLILNPSVEDGSSLPTSWQKGGWGTNTAVLSYPAEANDGTRGIKTVVSSFTNGDAKWYFNDVNVKPNTQYTFSDYYKSNVATELVIRYTSTTNAESYISIANPATATNWTKAEATFTTPANVKSMTVFHLIAKVGELTTDNYYLNETIASTPTPTATPSPTPVPTTAPTVTPTSTPVVTATPVATVAPTATPTIVPTPTATPVPTIVPTATPVPTVTPTSTPVPTIVPTATPSPTPIPTIAPTATPIPTVVPTATPVVTVTPVPIITPTPVSNMILNGSVESASVDGLNPLNWARGGWGTNNAIFTYPAESSEGSKGIKVELSSYTDGDAKWWFDEVNVLPNTRYSFTTSFKSNIASDISIQYRNSSNTLSYAWLASPAVSADWTTATYTFTTPADVTKLSIFHSIATAGWLVTDNHKLVEVPSNKFNQGMLSFNFDDGYLSVYENAIPMLNNAGFKSTQYILSETLGGGFSGYVNAAQVLAMQAQGHEIGAHSNTHADLTLSTPTELVNEVGGSKTLLENAGVNVINSFAYPYGNYNSAVIQAVVNAGYEAGRGAYPDGENYKDTNKYELRVVDVQLLTPVATVKTWIDQAIANKSWVILMYHQIDNSGDQYSTIPQNFQEVVNYAQSVGITVVTNKQGVALMN